MLFWLHIGVHAQMRATFCGTVMLSYDPVKAKLARLKERRGIRHGRPVCTVDLRQFGVEGDRGLPQKLEPRFGPRAGQPLVQEGVVVVHSVDRQGGICCSQAAQDQRQIG